MKRYVVHSEDSYHCQDNEKGSGARFGSSQGLPTKDGRLVQTLCTQLPHQNTSTEGSCCSNVEVMVLHKGHERRHPTEQVVAVGWMPN